MLIVSSVQIIALNYDRQLANYSETQRAQEEKLKETDFRSMRWRGTQVERRPNPLSVFAIGLEKEMARSVGISQFREAKLGRSKYANPLFVLFPAPDLLYIVNIVASLLAVLFAFDAICGEGEEGTLKLVMSNAVPRHLVLLAKWIGGFVALILPFFISVLCALFFAQLTTALRFTGDEWGAFAGILGVATLYISLFYALSLMVSTLVHRASVSLVVNFLIWVLVVLVVPNTAPIVARGLAPVPSAGVLQHRRHRGSGSGSAQQIDHVGDELGLTARQDREQQALAVLVTGEQQPGAGLRQGPGPGEAREPPQLREQLRHGRLHHQVHRRGHERSLEGAEGPAHGLARPVVQPCSDTRPQRFDPGLDFGLVPLDRGPPRPPAQRQEHHPQTQGGQRQQRHRPGRAVGDPTGDRLLFPGAGGASRASPAPALAGERHDRGAALL